MKGIFGGVEGLKGGLPYPKFSKNVNRVQRSSEVLWVDITYVVVSVDSEEQIPEQQRRTKRRTSCGFSIGDVLI